MMKFVAKHKFRLVGIVFLAGVLLGLVIFTLPGSVPYSVVPAKFSKTVKPPSFLQLVGARFLNACSDSFVQETTYRYLESPKNDEQERLITFLSIQVSSVLWKGALNRRFLDSSEDMLRFQAIRGVGMMKDRLALPKLLALWEKENDRFEDLLLAETFAVVIDSRTVWRLKGAFERKPQKMYLGLPVLLSLEPNHSLEKRLIIEIGHLDVPKKIQLAILIGTKEVQCKSCKWYIGVRKLLGADRDIRVRSAAKKLY